MILVMNSGSSSIKFSVYAVGGESDFSLTLKGQVDGIGTCPRLRARDAGGRPLVDQTFPVAEITDVGVATERVGAWLLQRFPGAVPVAVGHRVAHGGPDYAAPVAVDETILAALDRLVPLAPMHQPHNLRPIPTIQEHFPGTLQVACLTPASTAGTPPWRTDSPSRRPSTARGFAAMGFTACPTNISRGLSPASLPRLPRGRWWWPISGAAPACAP